jgi:drug/metabolite transporter (DMT)-like permease
MSATTRSAPAPINLKYEALLFVAAAIWGSGFVAQRMGMDTLGPFTFNGARFAIGACSLIPFMLLRRTTLATLKTATVPAILAGCVLTIAAALQQFGIQYTSAGKAGFITGLYVVLVPIAAFFLGKLTPLRTWLGVALAMAGLFLLSIQSGFTVEKGDIIIFVGAFFWTAHLLVLDHWAPRVDPIALAAIQFAVCSILSWSIALPFETFSSADVAASIGPLLYGGLASIGIAYTLQAIGQSRVQPARASIILSMEAAFAVLAGWLILSEAMSRRELAGCALMLGGIIIAQLPGRQSTKPRPGSVALAEPARIDVPS